MLVLPVVVALVLIYILFEYRIRKPAQIVLHEYKGQVRQRSARFYPRHFSLAISGKVHSMVQEIESEAKGKIMLKIRIAAAIAVSIKNVDALIRLGGWDKNTVVHTAKELNVIVNSIVNEFTVKLNIEELSAEESANHLRTRLRDTGKNLGVEILSLNVQSIEPMDEKITEAIRQQESARIFEQTEIANQQVRITAAKAKNAADERIAQYEHTLKLRKYQLQEAEQNKEAQLSRQQIEQDIELKKMQLKVDKEEISLLTDNPELLVLTPQIANLAEASQSLRNARTVVSLSSMDMDEGSQFGGMLKMLVQNIIKSLDKNNKVNVKKDV